MADLKDDDTMTYDDDNNVSNDNDKRKGKFELPCKLKFESSDSSKYSNLNLPLTPLVVNTETSPLSTPIKVKKYPNYKINIDSHKPCYQKSTIIHNKTVSTPKNIDNSIKKKAPPLKNIDTNNKQPTKHQHIIELTNQITLNNNHETNNILKMDKKMHSFNDHDSDILFTKKDIIIGCVAILLLVFICTLGLIMIRSADLINTKETIMGIGTVLLIIFTCVMTVIFYRMNNRYHEANKNYNFLKKQLYETSKFSSSVSHASSFNHHRKSTGINKWSKGDLLGCGSFGKVYTAFDHSSGQVRAKFIYIYMHVYVYILYKHNKKYRFL